MAIILGLGAVIGAEITGVPGAVGIVAIGVLFSLWFLALAILTRDQESTIIATNLLQFPLPFLSSAFLPLSALPDWIRTFARYDPVTYGVDAARSLMLDRDVMTVLEVDRFGGTMDGVVPGMAVLIGLALVLGAVAIYLLSRASSSDVR